VTTKGGISGHEEADDAAPSALPEGRSSRLAVIARVVGHDQPGPFACLLAPFALHQAIGQGQHPLGFRLVAALELKEVFA